MKFYKYVLILFAAATAFASCKKNNDAIPSPIVLTVANSRGTVTVVPGQHILITLKDLAAEGFSTDPPLYNKTILHFNGRTHQPGNVNEPGNDGTYNWDFTARQSGNSNLKITATRPWDASSTFAQFRSTITVK